MKKYMRSIARRLNLPRDMKKRVLSDLETSITARLEQGEDLDAILVDMGPAKKAAAELNQQMKEFAYRKSPWRFVLLAVGILALLWFLWHRVVPGLLGDFYFHLSNGIDYSAGIIGGADGPTAVFVTTTGFGTKQTAEAVLALALAAVGFLGFFRLRKCKHK